MTNANQRNVYGSNLKRLSKYFRFNSSTVRKMDFGIFFKLDEFHGFVGIERSYVVMEIIYFVKIISFVLSIIRDNK